MAERGPIAELPSGSHSDSAAEDILGDEFTGSFFGALMKNVDSFDQAERLAHNLNLPDSEIQGLKKDVQNDPVLFGIKVLKKWSNNHSHDTFENAKQELALKLQQSGLKRQAKRVWPQDIRRDPFTAVKSRSLTPVSNATHVVRVDMDRVPLLADKSPSNQDGNDEEDEEPGINIDEPPVRRNLSCCSYKWVACYGAILIPFVMVTAVLTVLYKVPAVSNDVQPVYVAAGDTVELRYNLDYAWLEQVTLQINDECAGTMYVVKGTPCSKVQTLKEFGVGPNSQQPVYLVSGSQILISIPSGLREGIYVWITRGGHEATKDYENYGCNDHPSNMRCLEANHQSGLHVLNITETSYYSVTFFPHQYFGITWNFTTVKYDCMQLWQSKVGVLQNDDAATVTLGNQFNFNYQETCMLLHVSDRSCIPPYYGKLTVSNVSRRQDILVLPGLIMGMLLVVVCLIALVHCTCVCFKYRAIRNVV